MSQRNKDYWAARMAALEDDQYRRSEAYYNDLQKQFRLASNDIQRDIEHWYQRLADNNNISYAKAKQMLKAGELKEFHWSVEEYIKAGKENAIDQRWMKELENASARHHISYLEAMKLQVQQHAEILSTQFEGGLANLLHKSYTDQYYRSAYEMAKGTGIGNNLAKLDTRRIDALIRRPWALDGANFSNRIWKNKEKLVQTLYTELSQQIIRGSNPRQAINNIAKTMDVSRSQARRLVMTESAAISAAAQKDCFHDLGVEQYQILTGLDSKTCDICQELDGKVFGMKEYEIGLTAHPFHPNCRCTEIPYFDDEFKAGEERAARGEDGKTYYVPADIKYPEWKAQYVVENGTRSGIIKLSDIAIRKSVGAKAKNYNVIDKATGIIYHFAEGTRIQNAEVFAGKGTRTPLHDGVAEGLTEEFGGDVTKWQHCKGNGVLVDEETGEEIPAEVHWFQEESLGKVKFKVKRWLDEG